MTYDGCDIGATPYCTVYGYITAGHFHACLPEALQCEVGVFHELGVAFCRHRMQDQSDISLRC